METFADNKYPRRPLNLTGRKHTHRFYGRAVMKAAVKIGRLVRHSSRVMPGDHGHQRRSHPLSFRLLSLEVRWPVERSKVEKAVPRDHAVSTRYIDAAHGCNRQEGNRWQRIGKVKGSGKGSAKNDNITRWTNQTRFCEMVIVCLKM